MKRNLVVGIKPSYEVKRLVIQDGTKLYWRYLSSSRGGDKDKPINISFFTSPRDGSMMRIEGILESEVGSLNQAEVHQVCTAIAACHSEAVAKPQEEKPFVQARALLERLSRECEHTLQTNMEIKIETTNLVLDCFRIISNAERARISFTGYRS